MFEIGEAAMNTLHSLMEKKEVDQYHRIIPVTLVERIQRGKYMKVKAQ